MCPTTNSPRPILFVILDANLTKVRIIIVVAGDGVASDVQAGITTATLLSIPASSATGACTPLTSSFIPQDIIRSKSQLTETVINAQDTYQSDQRTATTRVRFLVDLVCTLLRSNFTSDCFVLSPSGTRFQSRYPGPPASRVLGFRSAAWMWDE
ncbi:hypothetical protein CBL_02337 [Carabus blaptoides fortunei]